MKIVSASLVLFFLIISIRCGKNQPIRSSLTAQDSTRITREILAHRAEVDSTFLHDLSSPFHRDSAAHFVGIKWFPPDLRYYFKSVLYRQDLPETVSVYGTKGEERKHLAYGHFIITFEGKEHTINVYKFIQADPERYPAHKNYLSVWFTDETTGKETYPVGRYVDVGDENPDPQHEYIINLNNAYNPYCAYSSLYSCAIPRKEDRLAFAIRAGELKYHP